MTVLLFTAPPSPPLSVTTTAILIIIVAGGALTFIVVLWLCYWMKYDRGKWDTGLVARPSVQRVFGVVKSSVNWNMIFMFD